MWCYFLSLHLYCLPMCFINAPFRCLCVVVLMCSGLCHSSFPVWFCCACLVLYIYIYMVCWFLLVRAHLSLQSHFCYIIYIPSLRYIIISWVRLCVVLSSAIFRYCIICSLPSVVYAVLVYLPFCLHSLLWYWVIVSLVILYVMPRNCCVCMLFRLLLCYVVPCSSLIICVLVLSFSYMVCTSLLASSMCYPLLYWICCDVLF